MIPIWLLLITSLKVFAEIFYSLSARKLPIKKPLLSQGRQEKERTGAVILHREGSKQTQVTYCKGNTTLNTLKTLFLAWQDPISCSWFPIGRLTFDGGVEGVTFHV